MTSPIVPSRSLTPLEATPAAQRWATVEALFQDALTRAPEQRGSFLDSACADPSMCAEVEALIAEHEGRGPLDVLMECVAPFVSPPPLSATGQSIQSRYRIVERLGGGGMGVVYRARDERLERDVALKFLPPHMSGDTAAKKRFLVEARSAAALEHPNICTVHEIGETDDGQSYIVMTYCEGETLERRIARGRLPLGEAIRITMDIARGLSKAHERGIVHRDIKPANVMLTTDGLVKILDFGIAKLANGSTTQTVGIVGTIAYMSPEQAFGDPVDHRTDIWSLGVVLYEMLTGARPFRVPGEQALLFAVLTSEPEPIAAVRDDVPDEVEAIVQRALAKQPADRFASATELLTALSTTVVDANDRSFAGRRADPGRDPGRDAPAAIESALTRAGERRQIVAVACALTGRERLIERLSLDDADRVLTRIRDAAVEVATHHEGIVNHFLGDTFLMLFGVPTTHEDDALRGVRAALAVQARVAGIAAELDGRFADELRLRAGVHVGPAVVQRLREGDQRFRVTGAPADVAGRLAGVAESDAVLLTPEARRLAGPAVQTVEAAAVVLQLDTAPLVPLRVLGADDARTRADDAVRTQLPPLVGREREWALLVEQLHAAAQGTGRLAVLVGEAGVGKSRLVHELRAAATEEGTQVLVGRCDAYGGTTPFLPFIDAIHALFALPRGGTPQQRHDAVVAAACLIDASLQEFLPLYLALLAIASDRYPVPEHMHGELFQAAMLEALAALFTVSARSAPMILLLEDWHWADDASRAALRQLAEILPSFPLCVVVTSRPEAGMDWNSIERHLLLQLSPLDGTACAAIARTVLGASRIAPDLLARLHDRTGGNPFFLEELCIALREQGAVAVVDGEAAAVDAAARIAVPDTVQGVLRTRMDRLDEGARDTLRVASIIGREFTRSVLEDVPEACRALPHALERLKLSGIVQQVSVVPEATYRFKHALTQEVAYDSLLEHQRTALHAAVGRAIERRYCADLDEHVERLAHHFSRAEQWAEAVRYGLLAADRAIRLSQNTDALTLLERVEEWLLRLPDDAARRDRHADVLLRQERLCEALGLRNRQLALVETLIALLAPHGPSQLLAQAYLRQGDAFTLLRRFEAAERVLSTALGIARERGDSGGERNALRSIALLRSYEGRPADALANIERVLELGRLADDMRAEAGDLATMANVLRAMGQHARALEVLQAALARTHASANPVRYGALLNVIGTVYRELGDYETALDYFRRVSSQGVEQRHPVNASFTLPAIAQIQLELGRIDEALDTYRRAVELNRKARYADGSAHACRSLGEVLVGLGRDAEALPYLREAAALFAQLEDRPNEALMWRRLAMVHEQLRAAEDARAAWTQLRRLQHDAGNLAEVAEAIEGIARAERQLRAEPERIVERYEEALTIVLGIGDRKRELALRNSLGIVHWECGAYAQALRQYETALRVCREGRDMVHEGLILNSLGVTLHRLRRWDEARTTLLEALRVNESTGERRLQAHTLAALADVCLASGRLDEARASASASLQLRRAVDDTGAEAAMRERLVRIEAALHTTDPLHPAFATDERRDLPQP